MQDTLWKKPLRALFAVAALLATSAIGCAAETNQEEASDLVQDDSQAQALAGTATTELGEPGVVAILFQDEKGGQGLCTGELVAPRVVLTAAHCTQPAKQATVFAGPSLQQVRESSDVERILTNPTYQPTSDLAVGWGDIGAMILKTPLRSRPLTIRRAKLDSSLEGMLIKLVGFGTTVRTDAATAGIKRSGYARISRVFNREIYVGAGVAFASGCGGDSGGPALVLTTGGWELIALESHGDEKCEIGTFKTRVDAFLPFIDTALSLGR